MRVIKHNFFEFHFVGNRDIEVLICTLGVSFVKNKKWEVHVK